MIYFVIWQNFTKVLQETYFATDFGSKNPAPAEINLVSSGLVFNSSWNPGVSVSGGQLTDTLTL